MILQLPVEISQPAKRIVSLVPSQTELLYTLGLDQETVAITKFCVHPHEWYQHKTRVGGTKTVDLQKVRALQPDLIIANKEENVREQVEELARHFPVWVTDVNNLGEACQMIADVGQLTGKKSQAEKLRGDIQFQFSVKSTTASLPAAYLIWKDPYMVAGGDTFIHDMMVRAGFSNVFADRHRYPQVTLPYLAKANTQIVFLSSEPYPFKEKHISEIKTSLPNAEVILVDGEMFSWYGSRLLLAPAYFQGLRQRLLSS